MNIGLTTTDGSAGQVSMEELCTDYESTLFVLTAK